MKEAIRSMSLIVLTVVAFIVIYFISRNYEHFTYYWVVIPVGVFVIFINIVMGERLGLIEKYRVSFSVLLLGCSLAFFVFTLPKYTNHEAEKNLEERGIIPVANETKRFVSEEKLYFFKVIDNGKEKIISFHPEDGSIKELKTSD